MFGGTLRYCPRSCGNWVHVRCLVEYAEHQAPRDAKCPLCRDVWGGSELLAALRARLRREVSMPLPGARGSDYHRGARCAGCGTRPIVGDRYRCVSCESQDLCAGCFGRGKHPHHDFVSKETVGAAWSPAPRVRQRSRRWRPAAPLAALQYRSPSGTERAVRFGFATSFLKIRRSSPPNDVDARSSSPPNDVDAGTATSGRTTTPCSRSSTGRRRPRAPRAATPTARVGPDPRDE